MTKEALREQIKLKLHLYISTQKEAQQIVDQIEQIRASMESPRIAELDGMPRGSGGGSDALASLVDELAQLEAKYKDKLHRLHAAMEEVEDLIEHEALDTIERRVLRWRYIEGLIWEEVCVEMGYSWRQTHNIHSAALDKLVEAEMERLSIRPEPVVIGKVLSVNMDKDGGGLTVILKKEVET